MTVVLLAETVMALTDGILLAFAYRYFKTEQAAGTPFTREGADQIKRLGIRTIVLPLVAVVVIEVLYTMFGLPRYAGRAWSNAASVGMGITLILVGLVFRYGADLEEKAA